MLRGGKPSDVYADPEELTARERQLVADFRRLSPELQNHVTGIARHLALALDPNYEAYVADQRALNRSRDRG